MTDNSNYNLSEWICGNCSIDCENLFNCYSCGIFSCDVCVGDCLVDVNNYFICGNCSVIGNSAIF